MGRIWGAGPRGECSGRVKKATRHHPAPFTATRNHQIRGRKRLRSISPPGGTSLSWQNTAYNQPPHTGFFIGADMPTQPRPAVFAP